MATAGAGLALLAAVAGCERPAVAAPPAKAAKPAPAPANPNVGHIQGLVVRSDNPKVSITAVLRDGVALPSAGLGGPQALVKIAADEDGVPCDTEGYEIRTSNAVIFHPLVNLCEAKWALTVPTRKPSVPAPPPAADKDLVWATHSVDEEGGGKIQTLAYAIPESDGIVLAATCQPGIQRAKLSFFLPTDKVRRIDIAAPDRTLRYDLNVAPAASEESGPTGEIDLPTSDTLWVLLRRGARLPYRFGEGPFQMADASLGAAAISQFITVCNTAPKAGA